MAGDSSTSRKAYAREAYQVNSIGKLEGDEQPIIFTPEDRGDIRLPHDDPMVISAIMAKHPIERILVDSGSSVNLIYWNCFEKMNLTSDRLKTVDTPLYSFTGEAVPIVGSVQLPVTLGKEPCMVTRMATFMVVKSTSSAYNVIFGRPLLNDMRAVISSTYLLMKFPTSKGVGYVRGDQKRARKCYVSSVKAHNIIKNEALAINGEDNEERPEEKFEAVEKLDKVQLVKDDKEKLAYVGSQLPAKIKEEIVSCLQANADIFAWSPEDMPGIDPEVISHHLNVDNKILPVKQKKRNMSPERAQALEE